MKNTNALEAATRALDEALKRERDSSLRGLREGAKRFPNVYKDALAHASVMYIGEKRLVVSYLKSGAIGHRCHLESKNTSDNHKAMFTLLESYLSNPENIPRELIKMRALQKHFDTERLLITALEHFLAGEPMFSSTFS